MQMADHKQGKIFARIGSASLILATIPALFLLLMPDCAAIKMERKVHLVTAEAASAEEMKIVQLAEQGKIEASLSICERCLKAKPTDPHIKLLKAQLMRFLLEDNAAELLLKDLRTADLSFPELQAAAQTAEALDQFDLTKHFSQKALTKFPKRESTRLLLTLANALSGLEEFAEAEKTYLKAVSVDSGNGALDAIIYFYRGRKSPEKVVKFCTLALNRNKDDNSLSVVKQHKFRAEGLMQLAKYKESLADINYCIEKTPLDSYVFRKRAEIFEHLGDKQSAESDRRKAVEIDKRLVEWK